MCHLQNQSDEMMTDDGLATSMPSKSENMQNLLAKQLGPEYLAHRPGAGGSKLTYIEGWRAIALANDIFGFDGWSSETKSIEVDFIDSLPDGRFNVGVSAVVKVWLKNGNSHEDVGYGKLENSKSKADALDKCKKEAVTDALKRTLRTFGNLMGNCLYDKTYLNNVKNMQARKEKFLPSKLHRPEFVENASASSESLKVSSSSNQQLESIPKQEPTADKVAPKPLVMPSAPPNLPTLRLETELTTKRNDTFPPPRPKITVVDKRQSTRSNTDLKTEPAPQSEFSRPPPTFSDHYFDLNEEDLAQLDGAENSEILNPGGEITLTEEDSCVNTETTINLSDSEVMGQERPRRISDVRYTNHLNNTNCLSDSSRRVPGMLTSTQAAQARTALSYRPSSNVQNLVPSKFIQHSAVIQTGHLPNIKGRSSLSNGSTIKRPTESSVCANRADTRATVGFQSAQGYKSSVIPSTTKPNDNHITNNNWIAEQNRVNLSTHQNGIRRPLFETESDMNVSDKFSKKIKTGD